MADSGGGGIPPSYYLHSPSAVGGAGDNSMFSHPDAFPTHHLQYPHSGMGGRATAAPAPVEAPRRKRGRPRKYGPPSVTSPLSSPPSASPRKKAPSASPLLSSSAASPRKKHESSPRSASQTHGLTCQGFTPHTICVEDGEDVAQKILSFMHQLKRSVCIISASGSVCDVSLRHPANMAGLMLHEGLFEIISFSGSLLHIASASGTTTRRGGMSICLIGTDGRMIGGGVGGSLKAAGPVQVIASSFLIDQAVLRAPEAVESSNMSPNSAVVATPSTQAAGFQSPTDSTRIPAARPFDNYQVFEGGSNFVQHLQPEWQGSAGLEDIGAYHSREGGDN